MNSTLWQCWTRHAHLQPDSDAIVHWQPGKDPVRWTFSALLNQAGRYSSWLRDRGIASGDVCALIVRHHPEFYPIYLGVSALGAIPAVLAYPNPRLHPDKFRQGLGGMSERSGLDYILCEEDLLPIVKPLVLGAGSTIKGILHPLGMASGYSGGFSFPENAGPHSPALLQHSSGTTGLQKPVLLSHAAVMAHASNYGEAIHWSSSDKVVSWLPLYHDMGLIAAFHLPLIYGIPSVQIDPFQWVLAPEIFIQAASAEMASLAWLPNFAFNLLADKVDERDIQNCTLSHFRMIINSGEPIRKQSHRRFIQKFSRFGLNPEVISTSYGMAETTFAVTQTPAGIIPHEISVNRSQLAKGRIVPDKGIDGTRICVSAGMPVRGCEIRITDEQRRDVPPGQTGELLIKSESLFGGYRNYPEKTAGAMHGDWYISGDLGFEADGNYYIIGRKKDVIISAGRNIYPEDVEDAVGKVKGIIPGRVIAFGEEDDELGTERISVIAEAAGMQNHNLPALKMEILRAAMEVDVSIGSIYIVPPRWLIKSSAGKPGRSANRERILVPEEKLKWKIL